jgi:SAM-dependent methyltransferase
MIESGEGDLMRMRERFSEIYDQNEWGAGSGVGSHPLHSLEYSAFLQRFVHQNDVRGVVDFGCGDWQFSRYIDWSRVDYLGIDVVVKLIDRNRAAFGATNIKFELFDSLDALPPADLLICKDVLQHLPNNTVANYLDVFRRKFKFMLVTNDIGPRGYLNQDIEAGGWRTLQFDRPPFTESAAIVLQWTVHSGGGWTTKATYLFYGDRSS